jgi:hypothetical protein
LFMVQSMLSGRRFRVGPCAAVRDFARGGRSRDAARQWAAARKRQVHFLMALALFE